VNAAGPCWAGWMGKPIPHDLAGLVEACGRCLGERP
jgi:hypothetical protein